MAPALAPALVSQFDRRVERLNRLHSWWSLLRTARASVFVLLLAALALVLPEQTADELVALSQMRVEPVAGVSVPGVVLLQAALGFLALSAWYWTKAALVARLAASEARDGALDGRAVPSVQNRAAFDAAPRVVFLAGALLGLFLLWRGFSWTHALSVGLWAAPAYVLIRWFAPDAVAPGRCRRARLDTLQPRRNPVAAVGLGLRRTWALLLMAPFGPAVSVPLLLIGVVPFAWGAVEGYLRLWPGYPGLPALAAQVFQGPSVAMLGLALMIAPLTVVVFAVDGLRVEVEILHRRIGLSRPPLITFLLVWSVAAPVVFSLHAIRTVSPSREVIAPGARAPLGQFLDTWAQACGGDDSRPLRPIVVAVSGGASRAAIWGAHVLAAVQQTAAGTPNSGVFAVSSVSGGSLGAAAYMAVMRAAPQRCGASAGMPSALLEALDNDRLGSDALGPLLAGALLNDVPRALFSPIAALVRGADGWTPRGGDRAEALERAFEHLWRSDLQTIPGATARVPEFSAPFLSLFYRRDHSLVPGMPVWITNGTDVATGERSLTEPFGSVGPLGMAWPFRGSSDVIGMLDADVPISTAINNSARFAYLEPAGELVSVNAAPHQIRQWTPEIVDGGYFDSEGLQTAYELARWLRTQHPLGYTVDPIIVQASADGDLELAAQDSVVRCPDVPVDRPMDGDKRPAPVQLLVPLLGLFNAREAHTAVLLREVRDRFCGAASAERRFFHFYLFQVNGRELPLNWLLSPANVRDIVAQLPLPGPADPPDAGGNAVELAGLRAALHGRTAEADTAAAQ